MRNLSAVLCLLLVSCCAAQQAPEAVEPQHHRYKPRRTPVKNGIVDPSDFVTAWKARQVPEYINPCLALSISYSKDFMYAPGFELQWFSGFRTIRQFLKWNKEFDGSNPSRPRVDLTIYIAGAQGFVNGANDTNMLLNVWQQCAIEESSKVQRQVPGPAYFADYIMSTYAIEVPDQVLREVVADYWPAVNNTLYGASCDRNCLASTSNWPEAAADACGCNPKLISEFKRFAKFDPSNTNMANRKPNTFDCLKQLTAKRITIFSYRAALEFCFQASALQTGNGLGWRFATDDGYEPGFYGLLSFPEFVMPNYAVRYMRKVGRMQQLPAL
ncbi:hypothetical protein OEZ85_009278 [Tetradesmus obliquus]|uniref:Uncharacterized protein n=1 Tax=Tetradesmus obliquus TaxID=3088 RepID=A0ABY8U998_TETOB|nr:hypothetical protein OEZ85_009278 [Tetradesmus obliquus]